MATKELSEIMTDLQKSSDPHAGTLLQKVGNEIKELDGNTIASASNLSALSDRVDDSVEELQESIDNHSQLLFEIDQSKASKEYVNNTIENYTFVASYYTGSSTQDTTYEQFYAAMSSGQYKKFECQVFGNAEAYLLKNMYVEVTANGVDYTFSGSVRDKNYSVKFSQLHPAGGVLEVTESAGGLSSVAHDNTLTGDGTSANPLSVVGGGSSSPSTLFKTVADMQAATLAVGDWVRTERFRSVGQSSFQDNVAGGCDYVIISNPSTTDLSEGLGMDIIQLNNGLYAKAMPGPEAYPEQFGYQLQYGPTAGEDLSPYIERMSRRGVTHIRLGATSHINGGNVNDATYRIKRTCNITRSVRISGTHDSVSGYATRIYFSPSAENINKVMFELTVRAVYMEDLVLIQYTPDYDNSSCIKISASGSNLTSSLANQFHRLNIQNFQYGIYGASGFLWHDTFSHLVFANNYINVRLERLTYCTKFYNCLFNAPKYRSVEIGSPESLEFDCCNFGSLPDGDTIVHVERWNAPVEIPPVNERFGQIQFSNCNMEYEWGPQELVPDDNHHLFVNVEDEAMTHLKFTNCFFIVTPLARKRNYTNRCFSLGPKGTASFNNCFGPTADVDITQTGNYFLEKDFSKLMFDENRPCAKRVGALKVSHSLGIDPLALMPDAYVAAVETDFNDPLITSATNLIEFSNNGKVQGKQFINLDEKKVQLWFGTKLVNINSLPSNLVRVGNELYEYVTIDGRLWITRNLNLKTLGVNNSYFDHQVWGQYYHNTDVDNISSKLPTGWRIPLDADIQSLCGDQSQSRARALMSTNYSSVWPNATNSLGFNAEPNFYWKRPSQENQSNFNRCFLFGQAITGGRRNIDIRDAQCNMGGWGTSDLGNLFVPIRVCADA